MLIAMRQKRAEVLKKAREVNDKAVKARRDLTDAERDAFDGHMNEFRRMGEEIDRLERLEREERGMNEIVTRQVDQNITSSGFTGNRTGSFRDEDGREVRAYAHGENLTDMRGFDPADIGCALVEKITGANLLTPEQRTAQIDKDTKGGYLLTAGASAQLWDLARTASVVSAAGAVTVPMRSREMHLATVESDPAFSWVPELGNIAIDDSTTFGALRLRARKCATRIRVSDEAMKFANIGSLITRLLQTALAQEIDRAALVGDGDGEEPTGILNTTGIGTTAVGGAITVDTMIDTVTTLQARNVTPNAFVTTPAINGAMDKLKYGTGEYIKDWPGQAGEMRRYVTSKMTAGALVMGRFSDLVLAPGPRIEIDMVKDIAGGQGSYLIQAIGYFDCGTVWPAHFHSLTGITTS